MDGDWLLHLGRGGGGGALLVFSLDHIVECFINLRGQIRRKILILALLSVHGPVRWMVRLRRSEVVLPDLLVVAKQVVPLVVALVLATEAPIGPAVVLHPLPFQLTRGPGSIG